MGAEPSVRRDINYGGMNDPKQVLDLYTPEAGTERPDIYTKEPGRPIIVWIHGGGWGAGDKTASIGPKSSACTGKGFVFASLNYRLFFEPKEHPGSSRPAIGIREIEFDIAKAIRWLHENAESFGGDPNFMFVMGHSAGAQLAALICTDESYLKAEGLTLAIIKGCVPVDGDTYYPALQIDTSTPKEAAGKHPMFPDEQAQRELSAVMHVAAGKDIPPFLLFHAADFPETRTRLQAEILAVSLHDEGIPAKLFPAAGKTHLTVDADMGRPGEPITKALFEFLDRSRSGGSITPPGASQIAAPPVKVAPADGSLSASTPQHRPNGEDGGCQQVPAECE